MADDLAEVAARLGAALRLAGLPVGPGGCERFARAVTVGRPQTPGALYWCAAATLVSSQAHIATLEGVFSVVFCGLADPAGQRGDQDAPAPSFRPASTPQDLLASAARAAKEHAAGPQPEGGRTGERPDGPQDPEHLIENRFLGSATERLAAKDFAQLSPPQLLQLAALIPPLTLPLPLRPSP